MYKNLSVIKLVFAEKYLNITKFSQIKKNLQCIRIMILIEWPMSRDIMRMFMIPGCMWLEKRVTIYPNTNLNEATFN